MDQEKKQEEVKNQHHDKMRFVLNIPNILTLVRLMAIAPLAVMIADWPHHKIATFVVFSLIWATDFLDGYIARKFDMMTPFGKLFDPFVDKVFQVVTAFMLFYVGLIPVWVPLYYVVRETFMLFGSTLLLTRRQVVVYADRFGKVATFLFVLATVVIFFGKGAEGWLRQVIFIPPVLCSFIATVHYIVQQAGLGKKNHDSGQNTQNS